MKKLKRKLRGMTLVEIIIALAVFAMLGFILVMVGKSVEQHSRAAHHLNNKVVVEGPIAEAQVNDTAFLMNDQLEIKVAKAQKTTDSNGNVINEFPANGVVTIKGALYNTDPELGTNPTDTNGDPIPDPSAVSNDYNLKYVEITKPTVTTQATSTT